MAETATTVYCTVLQQSQQHCTEPYLEFINFCPHPTEDLSYFFHAPMFPKSVPSTFHDDNNSKPNVVVEWLAFLFRIRQVPDSNLCPQNGYPEDFHGLFQYFQTNNRIVHSNWATTVSYHIISNSSFTYQPFIRRYIIWVTEKASLNRLRSWVQASLENIRDRKQFYRTRKSWA
jgi:hypothetical protein